MVLKNATIIFFFRLLPFSIFLNFYVDFTSCSIWILHCYFILFIRNGGIHDEIIHFKTYKNLSAALLAATVGRRLTVRSSSSIKRSFGTGSRISGKCNLPHAIGKWALASDRESLPQQEILFLYPRQIITRLFQFLFICSVLLF